MSHPSIANVVAPSNKDIRASDSFLASRHNQLGHFNSVESLVTANSVVSDADRAVLEHHILLIRAAVARALWKQEIYVGSSLLDETVLHCAKQGGGDVPARVLAQLANAGAERPGFVLYPLTRFGMQMPGVFGLGTDAKKYLVFRDAGFAVSAQTNSVEATYDRVKEMAGALGVRQQMDLWEMRHFSHAATWIKRNPLMLLKITSHTGDMYENQFVYALKLRTAASALLMLHALNVERNGPAERIVSTAHVNNLETLDIRHYLTGEGRVSGKMSMTRVPMNLSPLELARLSDVAAVISTSEMSTSFMRLRRAQIVAALKIVERGYFEHVNLTSRSKAQSRFYKRLMTSLDWFRQSFASQINESEAIIAIVVAFETLLTDNYGANVAKRIAKRVGLCLKGIRGVEQYKDAVLELYKARNVIVHTGALDQGLDLVKSQAAFVRCFVQIASLSVARRIPAENPIRTLLNDQPENDAEE